MKVIAKEERRTGKEVKVGYMKIKIGEEWFRWNEESGDLKTAGKQGRGRAELPVDGHNKMREEQEVKG